MSDISELIVDAHGCAANLSDLDAIQQAATRAVESIGAHVVTSASHRFQPHGITLCLILKESHFIISTWPEHKLAVVNVFLCNPSMDTREVWDLFAPILRPTDVTFHSVKHRLAPSKKKEKAA